MLSALRHRQAASALELPVFLVFGQNYVAGTAKQLDPPMWSLAVEVSFYAALPAIGFLALRAGRHRRVQLALCAALALAGLGYTALGVVSHWPWTATATLPVHLTEFAAGMAVAVLLHQRALGRRVGLAVVALGLALVAADGAWHELTTVPSLAQHVLRDLPAAVGFALIVAAVTGAPLRSRRLSGGAARRTGRAPSARGP